MRPLFIKQDERTFYSLYLAGVRKCGNVYLELGLAISRAVMILFRSKGGGGARMHKSNYHFTLGSLCQVRFFFLFFLFFSLFL